MSLTVRNYSAYSDSIQTNESFQMKAKYLAQIIAFFLFVFGSHVLSAQTPGCTNSIACNFNSLADLDDGSCILPDGCMVSTASNYNPSAFCDDGSCLFCEGDEFIVTLTMNDLAGDGWNGANFTIFNEQGSIVQMGCLDSGSTDSHQLCLSEGCYSIHVGGGDMDEDNSWSLSAGGIPLFNDVFSTINESIGFTIGSNSCQIEGCMNNACNNFNPFATEDDGSCNCPPINDNCSQATTIVCGSSINGTTNNSSDSDGISGILCNQEIEGPGVWYKIIGNGGMTTFSTCNDYTFFDTKLCLFDGTCDSLLCLTCTNDDCGSLASLTWSLELGEEYFVLVHGANGDTGDFQLNVECPDCEGGPADECIDAISLTSGEIYQSNLCCLIQDDIDGCAQDLDGYYGQWFKINIEDYDTFELNFINGTGSNMGATIFEDAGSLGCENMVAIACCPIQDGQCQGRLDDFFIPTPNSDFYFLVYTNDPLNCGSINLKVTLGELGCTDIYNLNYDPDATFDDATCLWVLYTPNLLCETAIELECGVTETVANYHLSQPLPPSVTNCSSSPGSGAWYSFVGTGELHNISTCGSSSNTTINVYISDDGTCNGNFSCASDGIGGFLYELDDNSMTSGCGSANPDDIYVDFISIPGETYYIYVGGSEGSQFITLSCNNEIIPGCMDSAACNYNSLANYSDFSCEFFSCLCTDCPFGDGNKLRMEMNDFFGDGWNGVSYEVKDGLGNIVMSGDLDSAMSGDGSVGYDWFCLCEDDCYSITLGSGAYDYNISWELRDELGVHILSGGAPYTGSFSFGESECGCMDPFACNYESSATVDNYTCEYQSCAGCTDELACNYNPQSSINVGSCCYDYCLTISMNDSESDGWNGAIYEIYNASNDALVATGNLENAAYGNGYSLGSDTLCLGSGCYYINVGSGSSDADISWSIEDGTNYIEGGAPVSQVYFSIGTGICSSCQEMMACNYDPIPPLSNCDLCEYSSCLGCTISFAPNYNSWATIDDGSCLGSNEEPCPGDFNNSGDVSVADLLILLTDFGEFCPE